MMQQQPHKDDINTTFVALAAIFVNRSLTRFQVGVLAKWS
jgi:hypothetical protein